MSKKIEGRRGQPPLYIDRIAWKEIDWWPESPDQYPDGLPPSFKPEFKFAILPGGDVWHVWAQPFASTMRVHINWSPWVFDGPSSELWSETWMARLAEMGEVHTTEGGERFTVFAPGGEERTVWELPADKETLLEIVDALLYVRRRTHEHDWQGPDDGLPEDM